MSLMNKEEQTFQLYTREATLIECTNLDMIEVQLDISNTSSIYSIASVEDIDESTTSDYILINSFTSKPYGISRKIWSYPKQYITK